jgi:hypothetical protein
VTDVVAKAGGNVFLQVLLSSIAESIREGISGSMDALLGVSTQSNTQALIDANHDKQALQDQPTSTAENIQDKYAQAQTKNKWSSIIKTGASLVLGAALISIGGPMFLGASLACGFASLQSISKGFKTHKEITRQRVLDIEYTFSQNQYAGYTPVEVSDSAWITWADGVRKSSKDAKVNLIPEKEKPVATHEMVEKIAKLVPYGFYGWPDSRLGALNFFADLGYDINEILVYGGGMAPGVGHDQSPTVKQTPEEIINKFNKEVQSNARNFRSQYIEEFSGAKKTVFTDRFRKLEFENSIVDHLSQDQIILKYQEAVMSGLNPYLTYAIINLDNGLIRIGKTQSPMPIRWAKYKSKAFGANEKGNFYDDMRSYSIYDSNGEVDRPSTYKIISSKFKRILLDCQYANTKKETGLLGAISEEFYTVFVNRDITSLEGYDLDINNKYNPIIGDLFGIGATNPHWKDVDIDMLLEIIKAGFTVYGAAYILDVSGSTIERRVESISGGKSYEEFQVELIGPLITAMVRQGYSGLQISKHFSRFNIEQQKIAKLSDVRKEARAGNLRVMNFNPQSLDTFLKPIILEYVKKGMSIDEISTALKNLEVLNLHRQYYSLGAVKLLIPRLFEGRSIEKMRQIYIEPIIENLLRAKDGNGKYLGAFNIVIKLGWAQESDSRDVKQSMADRLMSFLKARWGFTKITEARNFFINNFLGYHEYDYYYLK